MSHHGSSIYSNQNPELKYKKALMEIQKIHNANKLLKEQSDEMKNQLQSQLNELAHHNEYLDKQNIQLKSDKSDLEKYLEECQMSSDQLRKEYNNIEKQNNYLSDVLSEQNAELRKFNAFKDEKGLASLIGSYQEQEIVYKKDISRLEQTIRHLKQSYDSLENEIAQEKRFRYKLEQQLNNSRIQVNKYRQLNNSLIAKNESIIVNLINKSGQSKEKYREAESLIIDFSKQLENLKSYKVEQGQYQQTTVNVQIYENLLQEKNKISIELIRQKEVNQEIQNKLKQMYQVEEEMKKASYKAEKYQEQCNMLKSKLVVLQTKDLMDVSNGQEVDYKEFEEKIMINIMRNDPITSIKNSGDNSHFLMMKNYVGELKEKLEKAIIQKKQYEKKYKSLKEKFTDKAEKTILFEEQNKIMKGKIQSYERLTERLQFQLQRGIEIHEEQMHKMKNITTNIINKKQEQTRIANAFIKSQMQLELEKYEKSEKNLKQQIQTLRLELSTERIKNRDIEDKLIQTSEFLNIYKDKFTQISSKYGELEENNQNFGENASRYEQLFAQQRAKNEAFLTQKQSLNSKINTLSEEIEKRKYHYEEELKSMEGSIENQNRKIKNQNNELKQQLEYQAEQFKNAQRQLEEIRQRIGLQLRPTKENNYYNSLEENYHIEKDKNRKLEAQIETLILKNEKLVAQGQRVNYLEDNILSKNDEVNDLKRKIINLQKQLNVLDIQLNTISQNNENLKKQHSNLKVKVLQSGQQTRRQQDTREVDIKKNIQRQSEEIVSLTSELRQQKKNSSRYSNELSLSRSEVQRLQHFIDQLRKKQVALFDEISQIRNAFQNANDENIRLKTENKVKAGNIESSNMEVKSMQEKSYRQNQENSELKIKLQSIQNEKSQIIRELLGVKIYIPEIESYINTLKSASPRNWQDQRDQQNMATMVQKVKKVIKTNDVTSDWNKYSSFTSSLGNVSNERQSASMNVFTSDENIYQPKTNQFEDNVRSSGDYQTQQPKSDTFSYYASYKEYNRDD